MEEDAVSPLEVPLSLYSGAAGAVVMVGVMVWPEAEESSGQKKALALMRPYMV